MRRSVGSFAFSITAPGQIAQLVRYRAFHFVIHSGQIERIVH
jgi:hypothetical protein